MRDGVGFRRVWRWESPEDVVFPICSPSMRYKNSCSSLRKPSPSLVVGQIWYAHVCVYSIFFYCVVYLLPDTMMSSVSSGALLYSSSSLTSISHPLRVYRKRAPMVVSRTGSTCSKLWILQSARELYIDFIPKMTPIFHPFYPLLNRT